MTDANTCLRWLARSEPDLGEAREAASRVVKDVTRAAEIISRVGQLFKKDALQRETVDINDTIREMVVLLDGEASRHLVSVRAELASDVPQVMGDRVQLQQVLMNLMLNGVEAMKEVDGPRQLVVTSGRAQPDEVVVSVSDTGVGLPPRHSAELFNAFFTTKLQGTGMGLSISQSIIQSHGGRLWADGNATGGAIFHFTLPTKAEADE